jgi:hypothetical protein
VAATLTGGNPPAVVLVLECANAELARGFFNQEAYLKLLPHREKGFSRLEIFQVGRNNYCARYLVFGADVLYSHL